MTVRTKLGTDEVTLVGGSWEFHFALARGTFDPAETGGVEAVTAPRHLSRWPSTGWASKRLPHAILKLGGGELLRAEIWVAPGAMLEVELE